MSSRYPKRKRAEGPGEGDQARNPKRQQSNRKLRKGYPRQPPQLKPEEERQRSINALRNKVRDIKRLLEHVDNDPENRMPQGIRIERERELETCEHELAEKQTAHREAEFRNKIIGKYHHIRFFERQKATRIVKRLQKQLAALEDESEKADKLRSIHNAEVDVNYTLYYPLLKPYVSLFPRNQDKDASSDPSEGPAAAKAGPADVKVEPVEGPKGDIDMWKMVEKAMEDHTLDALRESRDGVIMPMAPESIQARKTKKDHKREEREEKLKGTANAAQHTKDEDSDGGFFEDG